MAPKKQATKQVTKPALKPVAQALAEICDAIAPLPVSHLALSQAIGCRVEEDIIAGTHHPLANMSAMDGYGVRASDVIAGHPLQIVGESAAGHPYRTPLGKNEAIRMRLLYLIPNSVLVGIPVYPTYPQVDSSRLFL